MQFDQAICSRCIGTALPSLHSKFVSIFASIFFRVLLGATLNAGEVSGLRRFEFVAFILLDRDCLAHVSFASSVPPVSPATGCAESAWIQRLRLQNGASYGRWQLILSSSVRHSVEGSSAARGANNRGQL